MKVKLLAQSCLTLSDPMDCSLSGSSVQGIFQPRVLEWGVSFVAQMVKNLSAMPETWVPSLGREDPLEKRSIRASLREGSGTPLQYSCLENPMDRGAW